ncbi:tripartite tricarboxylate transporter TctB family protein, partial [Roseibium polysiphoniae]
VVVASLLLPVPGELATAPGLLPFLTAVSLGGMAILLAVSAIQRRRTGTPLMMFAPGEVSEQMRAVPLAAAIAIYIAGLQWLAFQTHLQVAGVHYVLSAFEPLTILALSAIMRVYWGGPLLAIVAIATGWTLVLSIVFQKIFQIPLPGGF